MTAPLPMARTYRQLVVWQRAMQLAKSAHALSRQFPREELYALTSQLRRAAVSIPANIAEGYGRGTRPDYANFLSIANGSLMELETLLLLAVEFDYVTASNIESALSLSAEVRKMLASLRRKVLTGSPSTTRDTTRAI